MGKRLSRIYTRTGDDGSTGLGDGRRVPKDHVRIECLGELDELNAQLGVLLCEPMQQALRDILARIQHKLFDFGAEICIPGHSVMQQSDVDQLEHWLDAYNVALPSLEEFILPGGSRAAALCHVARTVCRRAERRLCVLQREQPVSEAGARYLNRLSDLLFVIARTLNKQEGVADVMWRRD